MRVVLDASYTIALALREGEIAGAAEVMERIATDGADVPALWRFEVGNVLLMATRRRRIDAQTEAAILTDLDSLPITIDQGGVAHAWSATAALARRHRLTLYDAAYLELAIRKGSPLASLDSALATAARAESVATFGS